MGGSREEIMQIVEVDEKYRIPFSKDIRKMVEIQPKDRFKIRVVSRTKIVLERAEEGVDPLIDLLEHPAHVAPERIKQIRLDELEEELWTT